MKSTLLALLLATAALWPAHAQTPAAPLPAPLLEGKTIEGQPFKLAALKGKVVLVMFWNTGCAVCRDKMPELRQNYQGWQGKPFEMVLVSTDRKMADLDEYEKIISRTVPLKQRFVQLWAGETSYKDSFGKPAQLPTIFLVDKSGKVVERYLGRMPADAWDKVAELL